MSAGLLPAFTTALVLLASMQYAYSTAENKPSGPRSSVELVPSVGRYLGRSSVRPAPSVRHPGEQRRLRQLAKPPPYAVQMEPLVQYSQRDPLYQESSAGISKKFSSGPGVLVNHHGSGGQVQHSSYDSQIYVTPQPDYYSSAIPPGYVVLREPEPIIEIIVKEANHTLPHTSAPVSVTPAAKKREPVHVFFVKYKKDEQSGQVKYESPVAAVTPSSSPESSVEHHEPEPLQPEYTTPAPPPPSTTLRTVIHPDSETVHVNTGGLRITFGNGDEHHSHHNHGASSHHGSSGYDQQQPYEQQQGSEPQPVFAQTPERAQPTKRQQPPLPGPRFHFPPTQSRFLTPPPVQPVEDFRTPQFSSFPQFQQRPNFNNQPPQFTNKLQSPPFQQNFDSFQQQGRFEPSGKLEAVPFKQQATGKLVVPNSSGRFEAVPFNQPPPFQSNIRLQEPVNGLPPPPPPQTFLRPQPPTFFSPQFNQPPKSAPPPPPPRPSQPAPQPNFSQQTFVQPVPAVFSQSLPPQTPSFSPPQSAQPSFPKPQPQFQQSPSFSQNFHTSQAPSRPPQHSVPLTTPVPTTTRHQFPSSPQPTGSGAEIVQSITPSREELQRQQQDQFRREQEYYQEIQKLQHELDQRSKQTTTPAPSKSVTGATRHHQQQHSTVHAAPSTTTPAPSVSSTSAPAPSNFVLPDEVPEDLRQQLLSSGILSNADIQILDYDKVGDIPIESLPQEALQQFIGATGGQTPAASELRPQYVRAPVDRISTSAPDNEPAASETVERKSAVEVKVVRFAPGAGEEAASDLIRDDATTLTEPVELDGQGYSRYLPLQVAGKRFPLPDVPELRNVNVTSVVVLAPVLTSQNTFARRIGNAENVAEVNPDDVQFVAGESLTNLVTDPSERNFRLWLEKEKDTAPTQQSVILLVSEKPKSEGGQDVFMYDANTARVSKLEGELSSAFVEVALANSSSHELEDPKEQEATTSAPITISTGYSKTKH